MKIVAGGLMIIATGKTHLVPYQAVNLERQLTDLS